MHELTSHKVNPVNDTLKVEARDEAGAGGAHHYYLISGFDGRINPSAGQATMEGAHVANKLPIIFQNGPINQAGVNGVTHEALTAILIDRFEAFQRGPYACAENAVALQNFKDAQEAMLSRTRQRMTRGVEGTMEK